MDGAFAIGSWSSRLATDPEKIALHYWAMPPLARHHRFRIGFLAGILGVLVVWWMRETWTTPRQQTSAEPPARLNTADSQIGSAVSDVRQSFSRADIVATLPSGGVARATFTGEDLDQIIRLFSGVGSGMEDRVFGAAVRYSTEIRLTRTDGSSVFVVVNNGTWWDSTRLQLQTFDPSASALLMSLLQAKSPGSATSRTE